MGPVLMRDDGQVCQGGCVASSSRAAGSRCVGPIVWLATLGIVIVALAVSACGPKPPPPTDTVTPTDTVSQTAPTDTPATETQPLQSGDLPITKPTGSSATNVAEMVYLFQSNKWHVVIDNGTYIIRCQKEPSGQRDWFTFEPRSDGTVGMIINGTSGQVFHTFASEKEAATSMAYFSRMTCLVG